MLKKKRLLRFIFNAAAAMLLSISVFAQQPVAGTLRTSNGEPLSGATITVKGTNRSVVTDEKGQFSINAAIGSTLVASHVGSTAVAYPTLGTNKETFRDRLK